MAFCINCGTQLPDGSKFCPNCGTLQPVAPSPAPAPVYVAPEPEPEPVYVAPAPEPEPVYTAPAPEPEPVYVAPAPEPEPVYEQHTEIPAQGSPGRLASPIMQADYDMETGEEPDPVVGTYTIPAGGEQFDSARPDRAQARPRKSAKPRRSSGGIPKIVIIIAAAVVALAVIITAAFLIISKVNGSKAPSGEGTALVEIVDNAAYNREMGY